MKGRNIIGRNRKLKFDRKSVSEVSFPNRGKGAGANSAPTRSDFDDAHSLNTDSDTNLQGNSRSGLSSVGSNNNRYNETSIKGDPIRQGLCLCMFGVDSHPGMFLIRLTARLVRSTVWNRLVWIVAFALLFATNIQDAWFPETWDEVFDAFFIFGFGLLAIDIVTRSIVFPSYFDVTFDCSKCILSRCCGCSGNSSRDGMGGTNRRSPRGLSSGASSGGSSVALSESGTGNGFCGFFNVGSFVFWCDLIATLTVLYDISYLMKFAHEGDTWCVHIDESNNVVPKPELNYLGQESFRSFTFNVPIIITILRSARVARLMSADLVGEYTNQVPSTRQGFKEAFQNIIYSLKKNRFLGCLNNGLREEEKRVRAAVKIQRAWRANNLLIAMQLHTNERVLKTAAKSMLHKQIRKINSKRNKDQSQVGSAMRELTGQRVAVGIIVALLLTVIFTYSEQDFTPVSAMVMLHGLSNKEFAARALDATRLSAIPNLYQYETYNETDSTDDYTKNYVDLDVSTIKCSLPGVKVRSSSNLTDMLRPRERLTVVVKTLKNDEVVYKTTGYFCMREHQQGVAITAILSTVFILLIWLVGVTAFAGPVMVLVVIPIDRLIRIISLLTKDPLGYESSAKYKALKREEEEMSQKLWWTKEVLEGMETSFLSDTILRIGSLMKVGFGSAGVEIIRNNLDKGSKEMQFMNQKGMTVSCIFLFCDIRQFTDATEALQEEVFVFTNKIAAVVHSICNSFGGSANKNIGDAFLVSWRLQEERRSAINSNHDLGMDNSLNRSSRCLLSRRHEADKALLAVVRISIGLHNDAYFLEGMSSTAKDRLLAKYGDRKGPVVQMGFGLHAGKAVQGAIGSQRKLDATYISEAVEQSELLESSTKKYGCSVLMSDSFHCLLSVRVQRMCRKIDQVIIETDEDEGHDDYSEEQETMEFFTFDMDVDALKRDKSRRNSKFMHSDGIGEDGDDLIGPGNLTKRNLKRRASMSSLAQPFAPRNDKSNAGTTYPGGNKSPFGHRASRVLGGITDGDPITGVTPDAGNDAKKKPMLDLPTTTARYDISLWSNEDMKLIRRRYSQYSFSQEFSDALGSYINRDWKNASIMFKRVLEQTQHDGYDDGPSQYFLGIINKNNGVPPRGFNGYGIA